ncbi:MAG: hypothetical protein JWR61_3471 [Ferruginibacter sp.]|uniref:3-keto-disaccharide hydrolase n=1 Tax=Ferruginibacter sp. TaxID=1940288 RepID=UPI00265B1912|nr:DUF1080 domain-containing protein [Ferruginibacter sp.]MDB5278516.1 hypothetical protein [Ferruginibacter sp.]
MKQSQWLAIFLLFIVQGCTTVRLNETGRTNSKWTSLFNGKNLQGWEAKINGHKLGDNFGKTFRVENGILSTRYDQYDSFANRFGALYFNKKFSNFRLKVEYRFVGKLTPGAPSWGFKDGGIQYYCQPPATVGLNQQFPVCLEYNLHGGDGKTERPTGEICASGMYVEIDGKRNTDYCTAPTVKETFNGDEWVTAEIDVNNGRIMHFVNGEQILQFENPHYDAAHAEGKKFIVGSKDAVTSGYISLQSNSHPMDFRKIEIMEY